MPGEACAGGMTEALQRIEVMGSLWGEGKGEASHLGLHYCCTLLLEIDFYLLQEAFSH
jgi:hypothetical protein